MKRELNRQLYADMAAFDGKDVEGKRANNVVDVYNPWVSIGNVLTNRHVADWSEARGNVCIKLRIFLPTISFNHSGEHRVYTNIVFTQIKS